jgi:hypothetical protein
MAFVMSQAFDGVAMMQRCWDGWNTILVWFPLTISKVNFFEQTSPAFWCAFWSTLFTYRKGEVIF